MFSRKFLMLYITPEKTFTMNLYGFTGNVVSAFPVLTAFPFTNEPLLFEERTRITSEGFLMYDGLQILVAVINDAGSSGQTTQALYDNQNQLLGELMKVTVRTFSLMTGN
jgi:hypothetical protein